MGKAIGVPTCLDNLNMMKIGKYGFLKQAVEDKIEFGMVNKTAEQVQKCWHARARKTHAPAPGSQFFQEVPRL